jgi:diguanylate cyclase (GGDEF)-like protein
MKHPLKSATLSIEAEREMVTQHDAEIMQLLPILGPLFGLVVVLFNAWDHLIDPDQAGLTLAVRISVVLVGAMAYFRTRLPWTAVQRCGFIYCTHVGAIVICEYLLNNGFLFGVSGIAACAFTVSVVTTRLRTFFLILALPSFLFIALSAVSMPLLGFVNGLMLYLFSVGLAGMVMLVVRFFRQQAFLLEQQLLQISRHDSLTGAYNRGFLNGRALAVAMIDIDFFKKVNDTFGHDVGDQVIKQLVDICTQNLRVIDHFGRTGCEEFVCVLPETGEADAMRCAERLRSAIEQMHIGPPHDQLRVTISVGVALLSSRHENWPALLKDADLALYSAKRTGRNRVVLAA